MHREIKHHEKKLKLKNPTYIEQTPIYKDFRSWKFQTETIEHDI